MQKNGADMPTTLQVHLSRAERKEALGLANGRFGWSSTLLRSMCWAVLLTLPVIIIVLYHGQTPNFLLARRVLFSPLWWATALCCVWVSEPARLWRLYRRSLREGSAPWQERPFVCRLSCEGLALYEDNRRAHCYTWQIPTDILRTRRFLLVLRQEELLAVLPLRCFASPAQAAQAEQQMRAWMNAAAQEAPTVLQVEEKPALWRFTFEVTAEMQALAAGQLRTGWRNSFGRQLPGIGLCLLGLAAAGLLKTVLPAYVLPDVDALAILLAALLALQVCRGLFGVRRVVGLDYLSDWPGRWKLEIGEKGVRAYSAAWEHSWPWQALSGSRGREVLAVILYRNVPRALLPFGAAPFKEIYAALQFVQTHAVGGAG